MDEVLEVGLPTTPPVQEVVPVNPQMMLRGVTGETRLGAPGASCSRRSGGAVGVGEVDARTEAGQPCRVPQTVLFGVKRCTRTLVSSGTAPTRTSEPQVRGEARIPPR
jgi:hypothetical protein